MEGSGGDEEIGVCDQHSALSQVAAHPGEVTRNILVNGKHLDRSDPLLECLLGEFWISSQKDSLQNFAEGNGADRNARTLDRVPQTNCVFGLTEQIDGAIGIDQVRHRSSFNGGREGSWRLSLRASRRRSTSTFPAHPPNAARDAVRSSSVTSLCGTGSVGMCSGVNGLRIATPRPSRLRITGP